MRTGSARPSRARRIVAVLLAFGVITLALDQAVQWTVLRDGVLFGRRIAPFDPPLFCAAQRASLERIRASQGGPSAGGLFFDAGLGWTPSLDSEDDAYRFDWAGCRLGFAPLSREKEPGRKRVVAIGCSFTFGAEVHGREAWCALVDQALDDVEIGNLALGGYGLDQALLRWRRSGASLGADEVWMGLQPGTILRNVTVYIPAMTHWSDGVLFKPRFVLGAAGELELRPCPVACAADAARLLDSQPAFLEATRDDFWIRAHPEAYAPFGSHWTHYSSLARLVLTHFERLGRRTEAYLADAASEPYRITRAIVLAAASESRAAGARFRLVVLPDRSHLIELRASGRNGWRDWVEDVGRQGVPVFDVAPALLAAGADADDSCWAPNGHYSARGNRIVADAVIAELARRNAAGELAR